MFIGIAGGSGSGKTTLAKLIRSRLGEASCTVLSQDSYYKDQSDKFDGDGGSVNFDHPNSLDFDLLASHLKTLKNGKSVEVPIYDFASHTRAKKGMPFSPVKDLLVDGTLILSQPQIVQELDYMIFLDIPESIRFERRLKRDVSERGRTPEGVKKQFEKQVKPMHNEFVQPSAEVANLILDLNSDLEEEALKITTLLK